MASIFEREPIFAYNRPWDDETKLPEKFKFSGTSGKAEVHVDSGSLGMEFFYQKTLPDFIQAATKLNWSWAETFSEFENVLDSSYRTAWREVQKDHFSHFNLSLEDATGDEMPVEPENRSDSEEGFYRAVKLFVCTILDSETPRDVQYVYLAPGGDHKIVKDLTTSPRDHARRFKEMLRIAEELPPGEQLPPSDKLALQWFYMTFHRNDRLEYVRSGKKLSDETIDTLTAYFQSLFAQRMNDGTLERAEMDRLRNRAKRSMKAEIRGKRDARRPEHARRFSRERERGRRDGNRSFRRGGDDRRDDRDRRDDDRRRDTHKRSGREGRDRRDNQPKRGDRDGGRDRGARRDGDGRDAMAGKKPWSTSATKKGRDDRDRRDERDRRKDASHQIDTRRTSSDDESPDDRHDTDVDEDDDSSSAASSDADDNFAVAMAPPAKRAKTIRGSAVAAKETAPARERERKATAPTVLRVPRKKQFNRRRIASSSESDDGDSDDDEAFLASCDKALGKRDPLDIK